MATELPDLSQLSPLGNWALGYAARKWKVIPLKRASKEPNGRLVPKWKEAATSDLKTVCDWWFSEPQGNIGLVLPPGVIVLDCDSKQAIKKAQELGLPTLAPYVETGRGRHYYFRLPEGVKSRNARIEVDGVEFDVKGDGGYVVAPISVHPSGKTYKWGDWISDKSKQVPHPETLPIAPDWVLEALRRRGDGEPFASRPTETATQEEGDWIGEVVEAAAEVWTEGRRHNTALALSGALAKEGVPKEKALETVGVICEKTGDPERADRLRAVEDTYRRAAENPSGVLGVSGLPEEVRKVFPSKTSVPIVEIESPIRKLFRAWGAELLNRIGIAGIKPELAERKGSYAVTAISIRNLLGHSNLARNVAFVRELEEWRVWDGSLWQRVVAEDIEGHVIAFLETLQLALQRKRGDGPKMGAALAAAIESLPKIRNALQQLRDSLATELSDWDAQPGVIGTPAGVLDLHELAYITDPKRLLVTKRTRGNYVPGLRSELWEKFLNDITKGDKELQEYLQLVFGAALEGRNFAQSFYILIGTGANGKTTFVSAIMHALGDYAGPMPRDTVTPSKYARDQLSLTLTSLAGLRVAVLEELPPGSTLNSTAIKDLTSDKPQKVRPIFREFIDLKLYLTPFVVSNTSPSVDEHTEAVWRRIRVIPFNAYIPAPERDPELSNKLQKEADAIFTWLVEGYLKARQLGWRLPPPAAVTKETEIYKNNEDPVAEFLSNCTEKTDLSGWVAASDLYQAYLRYNNAEGREKEAVASGEVLSQNKFAREIRFRGFKPTKKDGRRGYGGLQLRED